MIRGRIIRRKLIVGRIIGKRVMRGGGEEEWKRRIYLIITIYISDMVHLQESKKPQQLQQNIKDKKIILYNIFYNNLKKIFHTFLANISDAHKL